MPMTSLPKITSHLTETLSGCSSAPSRGTPYPSRWHETSPSSPQSDPLTFAEGNATVATRTATALSAHGTRDLALLLPCVVAVAVAVAELFAFAVALSLLPRLLWWLNATLFVGLLLACLVRRHSGSATLSATSPCALLSTLSSCFPFFPALFLALSSFLVSNSIFFASVFLGSAEDAVNEGIGQE